MSSFSNEQLLLLDPSGKNIPAVNPELYLEIEHQGSMARATSIFLGGDLSNAIPANFDNDPTFLLFKNLSIDLRPKIWRMGDPSIVEITSEGSGRFTSKTLVPNIMNVNHESRDERSRRCSTLIIRGRDPAIFIDWNADTLMFQNHYAISLRRTSRIAIPFHSLHTFLCIVNYTGRFDAMEELYVIRPNPGVSGGGDLELAGDVLAEYRFTHFLPTRDAIKVVVMVDTAIDANRLLEVDEKIQRDKQRTAENSEDRDMLMARMLQEKLHMRETE